MEWKNIDSKIDNATKRYDHFVVKIHKLYEEMFSVQQRGSGNLGEKWPIYITLSGIITHGGTWAFTKIFTKDLWVYVMVSVYVAEKYFGGNDELFRKAKYSLQKDWKEAAKHIEDYINASNMGRKIPIKDLINYFIMLEKIRRNRLYQPFFKHNSFEEYELKAREYFSKMYKSSPYKLHELKDVFYEEAKRLHL